MKIFVIDTDTNQTLRSVNVVQCSVQIILNLKMTNNWFQNQNIIKSYLEH